ncbi:hypothetical protein K469DRAFT_346681 [Zopfia rhizophila CBS 207.26]|uniref:Uncharacterized protein n=1 Tax=Zopfia rhizophila CBS 207.26 TaxID=1314779 RepID=A0A6A6EM45_9PEZI|nr:hypothetical protein K469DRAFT_346681 [Zopfia rhizophila CBS 207.26]
MASPLTQESRIHETLASHEPTRVAIFARKTSRFWSAASPTTVIQEALSVLGLSGTKYTFLVNEKWSRLNIFVFDVFHDTYKVDTGHLLCDLPVIIVDYAREKCTLYMAPSFRRSQINVGVAEHHNLNGWQAEPPFFADHTLSKPPSYDSPRDTALLRSIRTKECEQRP